MKQGFATAHRDDAGAESSEQIDAPENVPRRHRARVVVVLVAIRARQIAAANGNQVRGHRLVLMAERPDEHPRLTESPRRSASAPSEWSKIHRRHLSSNRLNGSAAWLCKTFQRVPDSASVPSTQDRDLRSTLSIVGQHGTVIAPSDQMMQKFFLPAATGVAALVIIAPLLAQAPAPATPAPAQTPARAPAPRPRATPPTQVIVRTNSGDAVEGVRVTVSGGTGLQAQTDAKGMSAITVPAGSYRFRFEHEGLHHPRA